MCADFSDSERTRGSGEIRTLHGQPVKAGLLLILTERVHCRQVSELRRLIMRVSTILYRARTHKRVLPANFQ
jgi:hypothetical protein